MMRPKWMSAAVSVMACALVCVPAAHAAFPGKNGRIAFSSDRDNIYAPDSLGRSIWSMNPDGTDLVRLTSNPVLPGNGLGNDRDPAWSPDGTRIVFARTDVSGCGCGSFLFVMNADGTGLTQIPNSGFNATQPSWSPDGKRIAFGNFAGPQCISDQCQEGAYDIYTIGVDGTGITQLTFGGRSDNDPAWSPDGREIAFISDRYLPDHLPSEYWMLWKMNADGSGQTNLTRNAGDEHDPDWSPDGRRIVFHSDRLHNYGGTRIWVVDGNGGNLTRLTGGPSTSGEIERWPAWSPDGSRIAFTSTHSQEGWRLWSMNTQGTDWRQLTAPSPSGLGAFDFDADWQPMPPPRRGDFKNAAQFCKAERDFLGEDAFRARYGGGANAYGRCVSRSN